MNISAVEAIATVPGIWELARLTRVPVMGVFSQGRDMSGGTRARDNQRERGSSALGLLMSVAFIAFLGYRGYETYYLPHHLRSAIVACSEKADQAVAQFLPSTLKQSILILEREHEVMSRCMAAEGYTGDAVGTRQQFIAFLESKGFEIVGNDAEYEGSLKFARGLERHPEGNIYWRRN